LRIRRDLVPLVGQPASEIQRVEPVVPPNAQQHSPYLSYNETVERMGLSPKAALGYRETIERMGLSPTIVSGISFVFCFMFVSFIGQWMFWVGFVGLAQERLVNTLSALTR